MIPFRAVMSPHFNERVGEAGPTYLILHYTVLSAKDTIARFVNADDANPVSAHYMVDTSGEVVQFVDEAKRAWHAGPSRFDGLRDFNSRSVGIEIVNKGVENGVGHPFPERQIAAVIELCRDIMARHGIPASRVLGHSDTSVDRKIDPGEFFPWEKLAKQGVGLWAEPEANDYRESAAWLDDPSSLKRELVRLGYDDEADVTALTKAFQRHYQPERFSKKQEGVADAETAARLHKLLDLRLGRS